MTKELDAKLEKARTELENLLREKAAWERQSPIQQLAIELHDAFCTHSHGDQCDWFYNVSKEHVPLWQGYAQAEYLGKAQRVIVFCAAHELEVDDAVAFLKMMKG
jgi:hypothetical protein